MPFILMPGIMFLPLTHSCSADGVIKNDKKGFVTEKKDFKYDMAVDCRNLGFIYKATGLDYFYTDFVSLCDYGIQNGIKSHYTSLSFNIDLLKFKIGSMGEKEINTPLRLTVISEGNPFVKR
jgi:hypothetical protein